MKKGLIFVFSILSFLGINTVSARDIYFEYDTHINEIKSYIDELGYEKINNSINALIQYYNENLSVDYPYYIISLTTRDNTSSTTDDKLHIVITAFDDKDYKNYSLRYFDQTFDTSYLLVHYTYSTKTIQYEYNYDSNEISLLDINDGFNHLSLFDIDSNNALLNPYHYYYSNFDFYYRGDIIPTSDIQGTAGYLTYLKKDDTLIFPLYSDSSKSEIRYADEKFIIQPYYIFDNNNSLQEKTFTTINLNDYSYVILSLKDYSIKQEVVAPIYLKGQVCVTSLYNYGLEEKKDYISGWQSPPCTDYYDDYVYSTTTFSLKDITNHAVLYFNVYDKSKPNYIKIDNSVLNVSYITSVNEDRPVVTIEGKDYYTIPYSELTDTSILTQENGISNSWTCAKYDTNCFLDSSGIDIENLFSSPLETLETVWDVITSTFKLVTEFISLLPPILQAFLYLAFGVGIALGIIKIIL